MKRVFALCLTLVAVNGFAETAAEKTAAQQAGPCKEIKEACMHAGFVYGEANQGYGLWLDCIDPIMTGTTQPAKAKNPLPHVSPDLIKACKAQHPQFGQTQAKKQ